ncbi:hypothetical protein JCM14469_12140 [Desulfatiferula olefinivorans]
MGKVSAIGLVSLVSGLFMLVFKGISAATKTTLTFPDLTLRDVLSPERIDAVDAMAEGLMYTLADTAVSAPLYLACIVLGVVVLLIGGFTSK